MLESKKRAAIFLILSFLLALAAGYLVLEKVKDLNAELGGMTKIYVAKGDIPVRTLIGENNVTTMEIPNKFVNKSHIINKDDFIDKVSVVPLSEDEIITKNMLKPLSNLQDENNRLVAMYPSEKVQFDQVIETLDRVDIIVSTENDGAPKTEIFMRDVPVAFARGEAKDFAGVALEVSMEDAPRLIHIQNYADKVRILKANVGKGDAGELSTESEEENSTAGKDVVQPEAAPVPTEPVAPAQEKNNKD